MAEEREIAGWFTANGKHIPIFVDSEPTDAEKKKEREIAQAKEQADALNNPLKDHFAKENKKVEDFMSGKVRGIKSITMKNGQMLERYPMKDMLFTVKEFKDNGELPGDNAIAIYYNDGTIGSWIEGDDLKDMKLRDIYGIIWGNESTQAYAGNGIKIENYKELFPKDYPDDKGYEDDWRIDFDKKTKWW